MSTLRRQYTDYRELGYTYIEIGRYILIIINYVYDMYILKLGRYRRFHY